MMKLESGPAAYDRNYYIVFLLLCLFMAAYFLYDHKIGYLNKNRVQAKKLLTPIVGAAIDPTTLPMTPTEAEFKALAETQPTDPAAVRAALGDPLTSKAAETGETLEYFASAFGMATVPIVNGRVDPQRMRWTKWNKTAGEIQAQFYWALIPLVVGLYVLYRVYKAATLRAVIDDEGLTYGDRRIDFDSMVRLCDYSKKGWVDLYYQHGPQERKLRIDNQKIRKFDEIIDGLCEAKGFEDPRQVAEQPAADEKSEPATDSGGASESVAAPNSGPADADHKD